MKHFPVLLLIGAAFSAYFLTGCASSERAMRLSYDDSHYSAASSSRIEGNRKMMESARADNARKNATDSDFNYSGRQVNLWPLFLANDSYSTILWPLIDSDAYGFAFRPFFNQEGNEYSILFPLAAWNPVNKDGWALNTFWTKSWIYSFPLFYHDRAADNRSDFTFVGPVYWGHDSFAEEDMDDEDSSVKFTRKTYGGFFPLAKFTPEKSYVIPVYYRNPKTKSWMVLLAFHNDETNGFFPLARFAVDSKKHVSYTGPVWWYTGDDSRGGFFPLARFTRQDDKLNYVGPVWWYTGTDSRGGFFPLARFGKKYSYFMPLFFSTSDDDSTSFYSPLFGYRTKNNNDFWYSLLFYNSNNSGGFFPVVRIAHRDNKLSYAGPVWWYTGDNSRGGFLPLAYFSRNKSFVLPLYWKSKSYLYTPLFGWSLDKNKSSAYYLLGYHNENGRGVFPFVHFGDHWSHIFPVYGSGRHDYAPYENPEQLAELDLQSMPVSKSIRSIMMLWWDAHEKKWTIDPSEVPGGSVQDLLFKISSEKQISYSDAYAEIRHKYGHESTSGGQLLFPLWFNSTETDNSGKVEHTSGVPLLLSFVGDSQTKTEKSSRSLIGGVLASSNKTERLDRTEGSRDFNLLLGLLGKKEFSYTDTSESTDFRSLLGLLLKYHNSSSQDYAIQHVGRKKSLYSLMFLLGGKNSFNAEFDSRCYILSSLYDNLRVKNRWEQDADSHASFVSDIRENVNDLKKAIENNRITHQDEILALLAHPESLTDNQKKQAQNLIYDAMKECKTGFRASRLRYFFPLFIWNRDDNGLNEPSSSAASSESCTKSEIIFPALLSGWEIERDDSYSYGVLAPVGVIGWRDSNSNPDARYVSPYEIAEHGNITSDPEDYFRLENSGSSWLASLFIHSGRKILAWKKDTSDEVIQRYAELSHMKNQIHADTDEANEKYRKIDGEKKSLLHAHTDSIDYTCNRVLWGLLGYHSRFIGENNSKFQIMKGLIADFSEKDNVKKKSIFVFGYRSWENGDNAKTFIFPFIATKKTSDRSRWSFGWRLLEFHKKDGKTTGGHIFFIPFGSPEED